MDTIFALASAPGKAGVAVIRVSGPQAHAVCHTLTGSVPPARKAVLRALRDGAGHVLDHGLVLVFPEGGSFTGEKTLELQVHGSVAVVEALQRELSHMVGLRLAEPGEFTRRALSNGRMDLTQVEALSDLIEAETEAQRRQAQVNLDGAFGAQVAAWRQDLIKAAALLEASIDFVDEDVPVDVVPDVVAILTRVQRSLQEQQQGVSAAERVRHGFEVAIVGPPNAGKSTLLNYLAGRDAAITSEIAGTTRDVIEVRMDFGGLPVTVLDTAGLRESQDTIERLGVERARQRAEAADIRIHLRTGSTEPESVQPGDLVLWAKADASTDGTGVSGRTGAGVRALIDTVQKRLQGRVSSAGLANRERHRESLERGLRHLEAARVLLRQESDAFDLVSEEIRSALRQLEMLIGHIDVEHVLDEIFSNFCIGK